MLSINTTFHKLVNLAAIIITRSGDYLEGLPRPLFSCFPSVLQHPGDKSSTILYVHDAITPLRHVSAPLDPPLAVIANGDIARWAKRDEEGGPRCTRQPITALANRSATLAAAGETFVLAAAD